MLFVSKKMTVIYNGIRKPVFKTRDNAREEFIREYKIPKDTLWIGTVAELHRNKGIKYALEALSLLPNEAKRKLSYLIVGDGEEKDVLRKLIRDKKLENSVFLIGFKENAVSFLPALDCFLLPSVKEGLPYVLLEAGMAKLLIIASSIGGIPEIIEHKKNGILTTPNSPGEIKKALWSFADTPEHFKRLGENLFEKVKGYTLEKMLRETTMLYEMP